MLMERLVLTVLATIAVSLNAVFARSDDYQARLSLQPDNPVALPYWQTHSGRSISKLDDQPLAPEYWPTDSGPTVKKLDLALYQKGSEIFLGETEISSSVISEKLRASQTRALNRMGKKLPKMTTMLLDMKDFGGRLDKVQFKALRYYLKARYAAPEQYYVSK